MTPRVSKSRNVQADLRWGVRWGVGLALLAFVPALVRLLGKQSENLTHDAATFSRIFAGYVAFALAGGALVGFCRPILQKKSGSALVGAVVGSVGAFALVIGTQPPNSAHMVGMAMFTAVLGGFVGAFFGLWIRWRAKTLFPSRD